MKIGVEITPAQTGDLLFSFPGLGPTNHEPIPVGEEVKLVSPDLVQPLLSQVLQPDISLLGFSLLRSALGGQVCMF